MNLRTLPVVSAVIEAGPQDRVFDALLLLGPFVIGVIVLLGRSLPTKTLAVVYLWTFVASTVYRWVR